MNGEFWQKGFIVLLRHRPEHLASPRHLGMIETQVVKILGQPASMAQSKDGSKTLYYTLRENMGSINTPYSVRLVNGKVDWYGRDAGGTQTTQPMPVIVPMVH